mmetsp:Transcript_140112/g.447111  ORF Transcript_140112/g.447111 Transcript_140112/m.447111 type:complete len:283 (-) Transcript_140112:86-934(-)
MNYKNSQLNDVLVTICVRIKHLAKNPRCPHGRHRQCPTPSGPPALNPGQLPLNLEEAALSSLQDKPTTNGKRLWLRTARSVRGQPPFRATAPSSPSGEGRVRSGLTEARGGAAVEAAVPGVEVQELLLLLHLELGLLNEWCHVRDHGVVVLLLDGQVALLGVDLEGAHHAAVAADSEVMGQQLHGPLDHRLVGVVLVVEHEAVHPEVSHIVLVLVALVGALDVLEPHRVHRVLDPLLEDGQLLLLLVPRHHSTLVNVVLDELLGERAVEGHATRRTRSPGKR